MADDHSFVAEVVDRMQHSGTVSARRMFGGHGIFHQGLMFALIADDQLYLKTDPHNLSLFRDAELTPFSYSRADGKQFSMSYYQAPESFFEEPEQALFWAQSAQQAAARAASTKRRK
ncbi:MAG: TfoX/Sxy family protein [Gammaproteobacteria bacterium]|nr:TfoX/Sxy family protein [Gammaproteobacteria bacterium]